MTGASAAPGLGWQPSLLEGDAEPACDAAFSNLTRRQLDDECWIDHVPGWLSGADAVFAALLASAAWREHDRVMYGRTVAQPRLTASWETGAVAEAVPVLAEARRALSQRYGEDFDRGGLNLYRDGRDSVAWHGDRIPAELERPVVAIVSLGAPRPFLLRRHPAAGIRGERSVVLVPGPGDLLVTGGRTQRRWQHSVPKVRAANPRISVTFRHG